MMENIWRKDGHITSKTSMHGGGTCMNTNCKGDNTEKRGTRGWAVLSSTELLLSACSLAEVAIIGDLFKRKHENRIKNSQRRNSWLSLRQTCLSSRGEPERYSSFLGWLCQLLRSYLRQRLAPIKNSEL